MPSHTGSCEGVLIPTPGNPEVSKPDPYAQSQVQSPIRTAQPNPQSQPQSQSQVQSHLQIASQCASPVRAGPTAAPTTTQMPHNSCRALASVVGSKALTGTQIALVQYTIT
jgi:hypothetical protein